jgi:hypothetical protein
MIRRKVALMEGKFNMDSFPVITKRGIPVIYKCAIDAGILVGSRPLTRLADGEVVESGLYGMTDVTVELLVVGVTKSGWTIEKAAEKIVEYVKSDLRGPDIYYYDLVSIDSNKTADGILIEFRCVSRNDSRSASGSNLKASASRAVDFMLKDVSKM